MQHCDVPFVMGRSHQGGEEVNKVGRRCRVLGSFEAKKMCVSSKHCDFCQMLLKGQTAVNGPSLGPCAIWQSFSLQWKSGWKLGREGTENPNSFMGFCMEQKRGRGMDRGMRPPVIPHQHPIEPCCMPSGPAQPKRKSTCWCRKEEHNHRDNILR